MLSCHLFHTHTDLAVVSRCLLIFFHTSLVIALVSMSISVSWCLASSLSFIHMHRLITIDCHSHTDTHTCGWLTAWWLPWKEKLSVLWNELSLEKLPINYFWLRMWAHTHCVCVRVPVFLHTHKYTCIFVWMIKRWKWISSSLFHEISLPRRTGWGQDCAIISHQRRRHNHLSPPSDLVLTLKTRLYYKRDTKTLKLHLISHKKQTSYSGSHFSFVVEEVHSNPQAGSDIQVWDVIV